MGGRLLVSGAAGFSFPGLGRLSPRGLRGERLFEPEWRFEHARHSEPTAGSGPLGFPRFSGPAPAPSRLLPLRRAVRSRIRRTTP